MTTTERIRRPVVPVFVATTVVLSFISFWRIAPGPSGRDREKILDAMLEAAAGGPHPKLDVIRSRIN